MHGIAGVVLGNYASTSSPFDGVTALDYYVFLLSKLPELAF